MEKFARNTGLKLFRTSVKENLNINRVFQFLSERHIEAVSRWSTDSESCGLDGDNVFQIGQSRDVRVRFAGFPNESNDSINTLNNNSKSNDSRLRSSSSSSIGGIFLGSTSKGKGYWHPGQSNNRRSNNVFGPPPEKTLILNPFRRRRRQRQSNGSESSNSPSPPGFHPHHGFGMRTGTYHHHHHYNNHRFTLHQQPPLTPAQKPSCRMI